MNADLQKAVFDELYSFGKTLALFLILMSSLGFCLASSESKKANDFVYSPIFMWSLGYLVGVTATLTCLKLMVW